MKICNVCKTENLDTSAVCRKCGEVLPMSKDWEAKLKQSVVALTPASQPEKKAAQSPLRQSNENVWSPAMSTGGMFLVCASFLVGLPNVGLVMSLGGALSVAALVRAIGERRDAAAFVAIFALVICVFAAVFGLAAQSK